MAAAQIDNVLHTSVLAPYLAQRFDWYRLFILDPLVFIGCAFNTALFFWEHLMWFIVNNIWL